MREGCWEERAKLTQPWEGLLPPTGGTRAGERKVPGVGTGTRVPTAWLPRDPTIPGDSDSSRQHHLPREQSGAHFSSVFLPCTHLQAQASLARFLVCRGFVLCSTGQSRTSFMTTDRKSTESRLTISPVLPCVRRPLLTGERPNVSGFLGGS